jgi:hypothetical protein
VGELKGSSDLLYRVFRLFGVLGFEARKGRAVGGCQDDPGFLSGVVDKAAHNEMVSGKREAFLLGGDTPFDEMAQDDIQRRLGN